MARTRVVPCVLVALTACPGRLSAGEAAPERGEILRLLETASSGTAEKRREAEARLRSAARLAPALVGDILIAARRDVRLLASILGEETGASGVDLFFAEKLREAERAYREERYPEAQLICEAVIHLGAGDSVEVRARRLLRLARDRAFAGETLFVDLGAERSILEGREPLRLVLSISNRADQAVTIETGGNGILGQLRVSVTAIRPFEPIVGRVVTEQVRAERAQVVLRPEESWKLPLSLEADFAAAELLTVAKVSVTGQLVPGRIAVGGRTLTRVLRVPLVEVLRVPEGRASEAEDPLEAASAALRDAAPDRLFLGAVLAVWEGQYEEVYELLLRGAGSPGAGMAQTSFTLLHLLTGEAFGQDRRLWIIHYLSHERLPLQGPLAEW